MQLSHLQDKTIFFFLYYKEVITLHVTNITKCRLNRLSEKFTYKNNLRYQQLLVSY